MTQGMGGMGIEPERIGDAATIYLGDCREVLPTLADASVDLVLTDPPYPCIKRPYGTLTESQWHALMDVVVPECRRILKPSGSAVFILQPNSEKVGRMRPWLWEFMAKWTKEWGMVQDAWWWNFTAMPAGEGIKRQHGLMRASVKACVWLGPPDCYKDQGSVLWSAHDAAVACARAKRFHRHRHEDNHTGAAALKPNNGRTMAQTCLDRGGSTPMNLLPVQGADRWTSGAAAGHTAATPEPLVDWWLRYICPPSGVALDPFVGSGTVPLAAIKQGKSAIGIDQDPVSIELSRARLKLVTLPFPGGFYSA